MRYIKTTMKYEKLIIFLAGVAVGTSAACFVLKPYLEQQMNEKIESVEMAFKARNTRNDARNVQDIKGTDKTLKNSDYEASKVILEQKVDHFGYNSIKHAVLDEETGLDVGDIEDKYAEEESPNDDGKRAPYVIDADEFAANTPYNNQVTMMYFPHQKILVDDITGEFEDIESSVGQINMNLLADGDEDVVYIRNDNLSIDYEVIRSASDYNPETNGTRYY